MKNIKSLLVLPFFFYATEGYLKAFKVSPAKLPASLFVICNFLLCLGLIMADFQLFGNSDADGWYTQAVLVAQNNQEEFNQIMRTRVDFKLMDEQ